MPPEAPAEVVSSSDKRSALKALAQELKRTPADTSNTPGNIKDETLRDEVRDKWKEVLRQIGFTLVNAESSGWHVHKIVKGTQMLIGMWNRRADGQGPNGETPPAGLFDGRVSDTAAKLSAEVENLKAECATLKMKLKHALEKKAATAQAEAEPGVEIVDDGPIPGERSDGTVAP